MFASQAHSEQLFDKNVNDGPRPRLQASFQRLGTMSHRDRHHRRIKNCQPTHLPDCRKWLI